MTETFYDVITSTWKEARKQNILTEKQIEWGRTFRSLENPPCAEVARVLRVSRAASSKMKWRILKILWPLYEQHCKARKNDPDFSLVAFKKHERISKTPVRLVKRRGQKKWELFKAEKTYDKRLGLHFYSGYSIREARDAEHTAWEA